MNKTTLITKLLTERTRLNKLIASLTESQLTAPVEDGWSVKDVIAHLATWERRGTGWIVSASKGTLPDIPLPGVLWKDVDRINQDTFQTNRYRPTREILAEFAAGFPPLLNAVQSLTDEQLMLGFEVYWQRKPFFVWHLVEWRYKHYRTHDRQIREWVKALETQVSR
jgi:hypothetical protein